MGIKEAKIIAVLAVISAVIGHGRLCAADAGRVVVFASEKIAGQWIKSYFTSLQSGQPKLNECEETISRALSEGGIEVPVPPLDARQMKEARELFTVFNRYGDVSSMPNDLPVKAAAIIDKDVRTVVVCGVRTTARKEKHGQPAAICASAGCEVISAATRLRISTVSDEKCLAGATGPAGSVAVIREVCSVTGEELAEKLRGE